MSLRKIATVSAGALLLISVGASASTSVTSNASASRISRLKARKSRDYRDIKSINAQLAKLQKHTKRGHYRRRAKRIRKHESEAQYYRNNALKWHYDYLNDKHETFKQGFNDGDETGLIPVMNPKYAKNSMYRKGWVIGYIYLDNSNEYDSLKGLSVKEVAKALHIYNNGVDYIEAHHPNRQIQWNANDNDEWDI